MTGRPPATWIAILSCGCRADCPGEPNVGTWLTCSMSIRHQSSYRITGKEPIAAAGVLAEPVQLALFGADAA